MLGRMGWVSWVPVSGYLAMKSEHLGVICTKLTGQLHSLWHQRGERTFPKPWNCSPTTEPQPPGQGLLCAAVPTLPSCLPSLYYRQNSSCPAWTGMSVSVPKQEKTR